MNYSDFERPADIARGVANALQKQNAFGFLPTEISPNQISMIPGAGTCVYVSPEGNRCALGITIPDVLVPYLGEISGGFGEFLEFLNAIVADPDEFLDSALSDEDRTTIIETLENYSCWVTENQEILTGLQNIHDHYALKDALKKANGLELAIVAMQGAAAVLEPEEGYYGGEESV